MCGIAGFNLKEPCDNPVDPIKVGLLENQRRGDDATGYFFHPAPKRGRKFKNSIVVKKQAGAAGKVLKDEKFVEAVPTMHVGVHARAATIGEPSNGSNNHPVIWGGWIVVHNGGIANHVALKAGEGLGEVDSAAIPVLLNRYFPNGFLGANWEETLPQLVFALAQLDQHGKSALAFHAVHKECPEWALIVRGSDRPLVVNETDEGVVYGSEIHSVVRICQTLGISYKGSLRSMPEYSLMVVNRGEVVKRLQWKPMRKTLSHHSGDHAVCDEWNEETSFLAPPPWRSILNVVFDKPNGKHVDADGRTLQYDGDNYKFTMFWPSDFADRWVALSNQHKWMAAMSDLAVIVERTAFNTPDIEYVHYLSAVAQGDGGCLETVLTKVGTVVFCERYNIVQRMNAAEAARPPDPNTYCFVKPDEVKATNYEPEYGEIDGFSTQINVATEVGFWTELDERGVRFNPPKKKIVGFAGMKDAKPNNRAVAFVKQDITKHLPKYASESFVDDLTVVKVGGIFLPAEVGTETVPCDAHEQAMGEHDNIFEWWACPSSMDTTGVYECFESPLDLWLLHEQHAAMGNLRTVLFKNTSNTTKLCKPDGHLFDSVKFSDFFYPPFTDPIFTAPTRAICSQCSVNVEVRPTWSGLQRNAHVF